MRHRYDLLRIRIDQWGQKFFEVADHQTGVIFWTKEFPK
jgi:hypothetical protein